MRSIVILLLLLFACSQPSLAQEGEDPVPNAEGRPPQDLVPEPLPVELPPHKAKLCQYIVYEVPTNNLFYDGVTGVHGDPHVVEEGSGVPDYLVTSELSADLVYNSLKYESDYEESTDKFFQSTFILTGRDDPDNLKAESSKVITTLKGFLEFDVQVAGLAYELSVGQFAGKPTDASHTFECKVSFAYGQCVSKSGLSIAVIPQVAWKYTEIYDQPCEVEINIRSGYRENFFVPGVGDQAVGYFDSFVGLDYYDEDTGIGDWLDDTDIIHAFPKGSEGFHGATEFNGNEQQWTSTPNANIKGLRVLFEEQTLFNDGVFVSVLYFEDVPLNIFSFTVDSTIYQAKVSGIVSEPTSGGKFGGVDIDQCRLRFDAFCQHCGAFTENFVVR